MIAYNNREPWYVFLTRYRGSVFIKVFPLAIIAAGLGVLEWQIFCQIYEDPESESRSCRIPSEIGSPGLFSHPFSVQSLTILFGYVLVLRTNIGVSRYMEGIEQLITMTTKWLHAFSFALAFDRASERINGRHPEHILFRQRLIHNFSLMTAVALGSLSGDSTDQQFCSEDSTEPFSAFKVVKAVDEDDRRWTSRNLVGCKDGEIKTFICKGSYIIIDPCDSRETTELQRSSDKAALISMWINEDFARAARTKLVSTPPPIMARAYQEVSNGMLGLHQAAKILIIQFPFPFAQMLALLTMLFTVTTPFLVALFTGSIGFGFLICWILAVGYYGCNEIAKEVEEPFGEDPNDLPLDYLQQDFVDSLRQVYYASCASLPDIYDRLVPNPAAQHLKLGDRAPPLSAVEEGQLKLVNEEMQRLKIAPFPRTFGMEEILLFTLDGWKTKISQSTGQEDPDVAQYMYMFVRSLK